MRRVLLCSVPALAALLPASQIAAQQMASQIPAAPFVHPSGPHAVGTYDTLWIDRQRQESYTKDPAVRRKLPIQIWYPAEVPSGATQAPYVLRPEEFGPTSALQSLAHVRTNSFLGAPLARAQRKYPVLIYNHGAGWPRFSGTFITEVLASQGYIVVGVDHPGMDQTVRFLDGTAFNADTTPGPAAPSATDIRASIAQSINFLNSVAFPIWIDDSRFVLDRLAALNREPGPFQGRLDLDRIGMLGWSFGGAVALEMLRSDPRVKAAVDHDGRLFGGTMTDPIHRPFMMMHHSINDFSNVPDSIRPAVVENFERTEGYDGAAEGRATADWYDVTLARTNHGHFSDLPLFLQLFRDSTLLPGPRGHEIIVGYTLAFFDEYLKGRKSALLAGPSVAFPEVTFNRRPADGRPKSPAPPAEQWTTFVTTAGRDTISMERFVRRGNTITGTWVAHGHGVQVHDYTLTLADDESPVRYEMAISTPGTPLAADDFHSVSVEYGRESAMYRTLTDKVDTQRLAVTGAYPHLGRSLVDAELIFAKMRKARRDSMTVTLDAPTAPGHAAQVPVIMIGHDSAVVANALRFRIAADGQIRGARDGQTETARVDDFAFAPIVAAWAAAEPARLAAEAAAKAARVEVALPADSLRRLVGKYALGQGVLSITQSGDSLLATAGNQPAIRLFATSPTKFFMKVVDATLEFELDASGMATAVTISQNGVRQRAARMSPES